MEVVNADFEEGKRLRALGFYARAGEAFSRVLEITTPPKRLEVFFELSETFLFQGLYNSALKTIDEAFSAGTDTQDGFARALQMLRCFVAAIVTAKINTSVREADQIQSGLDKVLSSEPPSHCKVSFHFCYF